MVFLTNYPLRRSSVPGAADLFRCDPAAFGCGGISIPDAVAKGGGGATMGNRDSRRDQKSLLQVRLVLH